MSSLKAERDVWPQSVPGTGTGTNDGPPQQVFPDSIHINMEDCKKTADPFWKPDRPSTSRLYKSHVTTQGRIFCTRRMQRWLHDLPDRPEARSEPISPGTPCVLEPHEGSAALAVDQKPEKPPMSLFGSIRNRRTGLSTPAAELNNGRKSSASVMLKDMRRSSKDFFGKLTVRKKEEHSLRVAFIGNQHCGKDVLLSRYTVTASTGNAIYRPDMESFRVKLTGVLSVDNYKARTEVWDITHRNVKKDQAHPLTMAPFDVVVICVDIGNERNLKSVAKWQGVAQTYCPDVPTIVLGLKADLRPDFPTLRLGFLKESTAFTVGQGEETARKNKASAYYECSAKTGEGVTEFFESLVRFAVQASRTRTKLRQKASRRFSSLFRTK
ncbi:hypothetical protein DHEL01_v201657 [Diaporthe helianthi]|uniref:Uncharacterized protein n=1 Tax=Diaporthe helianthi TaxID=158607 RepID=A0A2P5IBS3_DIAHE|nr:hypothetical protein DHEL01_v201657 [Diaporthe helianthi]